MASAPPVCGDRSGRVTERPESYFICTQDKGHRARHSACDGKGTILARWGRSGEMPEVNLGGVLVTPRMIKKLLAERN